ncbi:phosphoglycerate kinase, partial [Candidatus Berkelbacteria bacterium CG_4_10_14_0_8_um_filter_42_34]
DWNVPLKEGKITDDTRIAATIPTIQFLQSKNSKVVIGTHLGRPEGEIVPELTTSILARKFSELTAGKVYATDYVIEHRVREQVKKLKSKDVLVLGNLRWYAEEQNNNLAFANILASYADIYVNDAFAVSHRAHASVEAITKFLPSYPGFLLEKEITSLGLLTEAPRHPFLLVLGGAKIKDKVGLIKRFIKIADYILIGGAIASTFKYFKGEDISQSYYEPQLEDTIEEIVDVTAGKLILPIDDRRADLGEGKFSILDIGPGTVENFKKYINQAKTIFWNGNMGHSEEKEFEFGTLEIAKAISDNKFIRVVAGGDTIGFINSHGLISGYSFISTGGGAALEFLAGIELPGLKVLGYYDK